MFRGTSRVPRDTDTVLRVTETVLRGTGRVPRGTETVLRVTGRVSRGTDRVPRGTDTVLRGTSRVPRGTETVLRGTGRVPRGTSRVLKGFKCISACGHCHGVGYTDSPERQDDSDELEKRGEYKDLSLIRTFVYYQ